MVFSLYCYIRVTVFSRVRLLEMQSHLPSTCSRLTIETLEQGVKYV